MNLKYLVDEASSGKNVKQILKSKLNLSERLVKRLKYSGKVFCNGNSVYVNKVVSEGDLIEVAIDFVEDSYEVVPENIHIDILYEDDSLIAVDKKQGMVVHPTCSHQSGTIANALMHHLRKNGVQLKIRPVSRLDRDTSGVIIFAKNQYIQQSLINQMSDKSFVKEYIGIVHGEVRPAKDTINLPIARKPGSIMLRHVSPDGAPSVTHYETLERLENATLLKFKLETGRTHQIRVHCKEIGHPLLGDTLYSDFHTDLISRQALHSVKSKFTHPITGKPLEIVSPIPSDICFALEILKK
ncbi:MAG: RluA family pseudouridine synthase [Clostridia bacterium]|nr:RluA family pseudouridine synthase [Clostridia bacterium]